jgi:hypothetical protein
MSQFGEAAHIEAIFREIGFGSRVLFDVGARLELSNSRQLITRHAFQATLVEGDPPSADKLRKIFPTATVVEKYLKPEEVNEYCPKDCWFFTLDIDSFDWWMWANLIQRPALVIVETNPLPGFFVAAMTATKKDADGYGMSLSAANILAWLKNYEYIGRTEVNAFYVRKELGCKYRLPEIDKHLGRPCSNRNNVCA